MEEGAHSVGDTKYLASVLRSMKEDYKEMFGFPMDSAEQFTDENVQNFVRSNLEMGDLVEKEGKVYLEMAPPNKLPANPGVKLATPMSTYRQYLDEFVVSCPYDIENDVLATTPLAESIATHVGAVIFNENSVDKPHKPVYKACAEFINKLEGSVLVVGDINGAVTIKLSTNRQIKVLPFTEHWAAQCYEWLHDKQDYMCEWDEVSATMSRIHFDHIVYLFRGENYVQLDSGYAKVHYLDFIPGKFMVKIAESKYMYKGKNLTVYHKRSHHSVPHTVLFGKKSDAIMFQTLWWTSEMPKNFSSSMIPLSPENAIGWPEALVCSEKKDGVPVSLIVQDKQCAIIEEGKILHKFMVDKGSDHVLLCERIDKKIYILEPIYGDYQNFDEWLTETQKLPTFKTGAYEIHYKKWFTVKPQVVKAFLEGDSEGVCFKRKDDRLGQMDPIYKKISTYYVKNPKRASYEDYVFSLKGVYQGTHSLYLDPDKVYVGEGVYDVSAFEPIQLIRKRNKDNADEAWYVDTVKMQFNYDKFLIAADTMMFNIAQDGDGGLVHLSRKDCTIAKENCVKMDGINMVYTTGFYFNIGHKIYAKGRIWRVTLKRKNPEMEGEFDYYCVRIREG